MNTATFIKKSKVTKNGRLYQLSPPLEHEGRKWNVVRVTRAKAKPIIEGFISWPAVTCVEVLGDDFKTSRQQGKYVPLVLNSNQYLPFSKALLMIGYKEIKETK
jgi:hypothetical protein